ncbi:MAG: amidohydrolase family protein [Alphaproteobacteria bacterium]|nr:amidohydrolase family protein [Alphaproteobacteria bacterium]
MHDLVIRDAEIVDGTGAAPFRGAVAVTAGRITAVGADPGAARETVRADGLCLMPGIIDTHTHYDAQLTWDAYATPSTELGVTTVVIGNCGFTIAPCRPADRERTLRNLTQVEGMSLEALLTGTRWEFETFPQYLDMLERAGVVPNVAAFCGHSSLRTWVMGEAATERAARPEEIGQMRALLADAMRAGAVGFANSTFEGHNGWGGIPMPSRLADDAETRALVNVLGEAGRGLYMLTKGGVTSIPYLESLAAESGRPVMVAALQYDHANPTRVFDDLAGIAAAVGRGRRLYGQVACTPVTMDFRLDGAYLFEAMAAWKPAIALYGRPDELKRLYADPAFRAAVRTELVREGSLNRFTDQWHTVEIVTAAKPQHAAFEGRNAAELAAGEGKHPFDWLLDFGIAEDFGTLFTAQIINSDEAQVLRLLKDPNSSVALSDAGAHLTLFCDAGFGLHLLSRWVRERGDLTIEAAVHELSGKPARIFGLKGRGTIAPGEAADLMLFDRDTVARGPKRRVDDLPAGATRLVTPAIGIHGVWVNGARIVDPDGLIPGKAGTGRVLRDFAA